MNAQFFQEKNGDGSGRDPAGGLPAGRTSAASVVTESVLDVVPEICVTGAVDIRKIAVIGGMLVVIPDQQGDRRSGGFSLEDAGKDFHPVRLRALCGVAVLAGLPAVQKRLDPLFRE